MEYNLDEDKILKSLKQLGLKNISYNDLYCAAISRGKELVKNPSLKIGQFTDSTYFIFENNILAKIGKVGGGSRCLYRRIYDYKSNDPVGILITESIKKGNNVIIFAINFESEPEEIYGVLTEGSIRGPKLEKSLLETAKSLNIDLKWNKNKG